MKPNFKPFYTSSNYVLERENRIEKFGKTIHKQLFYYAPLVKAKRV
jgi:ribosomal protein L31